MILGYPTQMNFGNPTKIDIGMTGRFFGRQYRVVGRAVLGEMEYGRMYYWNEYYLETEGQDLETLVYEETNLGGEWRWFTMFDPETPINATQASEMREGQTIDLDGVEARITLVRESQVCFTEGQAPEGVRVGSRANYFNALKGPKMLVVSWTGEEVEFYRGTNLSPADVASGFDMTVAGLVKFTVLTPMKSSSSFVGLVVIAVFIFVFVAIVFANCEMSLTPTPPAVITRQLAAPPLKIGDTGTLNGTSYRIDGYTQVKIAEMGLVVTRHEYFLRDAGGNDVLLICGGIGAAPDWMLFARLPFDPSAPSPQQAGAVRLGQTVSVNGLSPRVDELFQCTVLHFDGMNEPGSVPGEIRYGFSSRTGATVVLARWNESGIIYRAGTPVEESTVLRAFTSAEQK